jgi:hypothetical protein
VRGQWPLGEVDRFEAEAVRALCEALLGDADALGLRELARRAQMSHSSLKALLEGAVWPDAVSIARLERAVGRRLWPPVDG